MSVQSNKLSRAINNSLDTEKESVKRIFILDYICLIKVKCIRNAIFVSFAVNKKDLCSNESVNFFDEFGYCEDYRYIFDGIKEITNLPNKDIANIVQNKLKCDNINDDLQICYYKFTLDKSIII